jgi:hypothetical protein
VAACVRRHHPSCRNPFATKSIKTQKAILAESKRRNSARAMPVFREALSSASRTDFPPTTPLQMQTQQQHCEPANLNYYSQPPTPDSAENNNRYTDYHRNNNPSRQARRPSPGLAARLKALGFGSNSSKPKSTSLSPASDQVGRIPEDQLRQLDHIHRTKSLNSGVVPRRGRAWSGGSGHLTPQLTGGSFHEPLNIGEDIARVFEGGSRRDSSVASSGDRMMTTYAERGDMDTQKYRLPEHTNGNGTKAMSATKQAHFERDHPLPEEIEIPPPPISKDAPPSVTTPGEPSDDVPSYFNPSGLQRTQSIYTLSRASFANQLAQLTSLQLPDAESLSTKVSAIPTSKYASKALMGAAEQIRSWIFKASEVVSGLGGEDDVEWAAAGGREGLAEVDNAISRFEQLIKVYVSAIEALQNRPDITMVPAKEQKYVVVQVETILKEWEKIKSTLKEVKNSVEIAMEWEELWNIVLGDIGNELDILSRLVFEMEEKRHKSLLEEAGGDIDINELQTIVEETPPSKARMQANNRFSMPVFPMSPTSPDTPTAPADSSLLALFARMQPLRASLDFLPMRLDVFEHRAKPIFPTAVEELKSRQTSLERTYASLQNDAESLRMEIGEDKWVLIFRSAARKNQKMYESVERIVIKIKAAVDTGLHLNNPATMGKLIESYESKKVHYGRAIEQVLFIIENGVKDRSTVNGEILRLHSDMRAKWNTLKDHMAELDLILEEIQADKRNQQLRDSISSIVSIDRSTIGSFGTPGSSPASSVVPNGYAGGLDPHTPLKNGKLRAKPSSRSSERRTPVPSVQLPQRSGLTRLSNQTQASVARSTPSPRSNSRAGTASSGSRPPASHTTVDGRPRWNASVNTQGTMIGHNFKPLSLTTPSPHAKTPPTLHHSRSSFSNDSKIPLRSPLMRESTASPAPELTPSRTSNSRLAFRSRLSSPGPYSQITLSKNSLPPRPKGLQTQSSMSALTNSTNRRASMQPQSSDPTSFSSPVSKPTRPASSLAANRRVSLLPQPRGRTGSGVTGRESPAAVAGAASAMRRLPSGIINTNEIKDNKKAWR